MCVPIEHPFPSINPARTGTGPCGGAPPHGPFAPLRPFVLAQRRGGAGADQEVDVRVGRHRGELLARRPRVPRVRVAPPEHRLYALDRRRPPVVAQDGPRLRVHPPSITLLVDGSGPALARAGARWVNSVPADTLSPCRRTSPSSTRRGQCASTAGTPMRSCRCAWPDRRSKGNSRPSWAPSPKGYLTAPEKVICLRGR